ncbi:MAG: hypothetical protein ABIG20_03145 [archaeon]
MTYGKRSGPFQKVKDLIFRLPAWAILLIIILLGVLTFLILLGLFTSGISSPSSGPSYLMLFLLFPIFAFSSAAQMNRNGLEMAFLMLFVITITFGPTVGFITALAAAMVTFLLELYETPLDAFIEKSFLHNLSNFLNLMTSSTVLWVFLSFFGMNFVLANFLLVYMIAFAAGRSMKMALLIVGQIPPIKVGVSNMTCFVINYYFAILLAPKLLEFVA